MKEKNTDNNSKEGASSKKALINSGAKKAMKMQRRRY